MFFIHLPQTNRSHHYMRKIKIPLIAKIGIAILLGIGLGFMLPNMTVRIFLTFNGLFSNFLNFIVPLLIVGLVVPGIADLGKGAGKMLLLTASLAYGFTLFSGFLTFFSAEFAYPFLIDTVNANTLLDENADKLTPFFTIEMPPAFGVMTALIGAFTFGLGITMIEGKVLKNAADEFKDIILLVINKVIIPLLPIYIFGVFLNITASGEVAGVMMMFLKVVVFIFLLTLVLLLVQFIISGVVGNKNPLKLLKNMMPAYLTALGTQSSAATIPVTLDQTVKNGVDKNLAGFVVPLCATIHLSGSTLKIVACAMAIMMAQGEDIQFMEFAGFIMMLGVAMVAAPGVPGGAIMAAIGLLQGMLGFNETSIALMIALYIAMDSFGTACNVTGDGAIAVIIDRIKRGKVHD